MVKGNRLPHQVSNWRIKQKKSNGLFNLAKDTLPSNGQNGILPDFSELKEISIFNEAKRANTAETSKYGNEVRKAISTERPVTPINDSIQGVPDKFDALSEHIRRRIQPRPSWCHLKEQDQVNMASIILGEAYNRWHTFCMLADDPSLSKRLNMELRRRIIVQVVLMCEQLFLYHSNHILLLNGRGVYSHSANLTRTYAKLTLDLDKFLNVYAIRRRSLEELRDEIRSGEKLGRVGHADDILKKIDPVIAVAPSAPSKLSFRSLIKTKSSRAVGTSAKLNVEREVRDITKQIQPLDFTKHPVFQIMSLQMKNEERKAGKSRASSRTHSSSCDDTTSLSGYTEMRHVELIHRLALKKCPSMRNLKASLTILEELNTDRSKRQARLFGQTKIEDDERNRKCGRRSRCKSVDSCLSDEVWYGRCLNISETNGKPTSEGLSKAGAERLERDLAQLTKRLSVTAVSLNRDDDDADDDDDEEADLPPLLGAISRHERQTRKVERLKIEDEEDDRKRAEARKLDEDASLVPPPICPQPPVIQMKMRTGKNVSVDQRHLLIRIADVAVPNNVEIPKPELELQQPMFNILQGEMSSGMVKELDASLYDDTQLDDVFNQIMATVDEDHLLFDNDPKVLVPAAAPIDLNQVLSSNTLRDPPSRQIINHQLAHMSRIDSAPQVHHRSSTDDQQCGVVAIDSSNQHQATTASGKPHQHESSWLEWWRSTVTSDDYLKYISTQETDYLSVLFHFYDSQATRSASCASSQSSIDEERMRRIMERRRAARLEQLIDAKTASWEGMWNVQTVTLGGLGRMPADDDELEETRKPTSPVNVPKSGSGVAAVHQLEDSSGFLYSGSVAENKYHVSWRQDKDEAIEARDTENKLEANSLPNVETTVLNPVQGPGIMDRRCHNRVRLLTDLFGNYCGKDRASQPLELTQYIEARKQDEEMQRRLDKVWRRLRMTNAQVMDQTAKLTSNPHRNSIEKIVESWEEVSKLIYDRESILAELESFERFASDPNRFFATGTVGRLDEAKRRSALYKRLGKVERKVTKMLTYMRDEHGESVTFAGREYMEKMKADRVEMLYYLEQERRCDLLGAAGRRYFQLMSSTQKPDHSHHHHVVNRGAGNRVRLSIPQLPPPTHHLS